MFTDEMKQKIEEDIHGHIDTIVWQYFEKLSKPDALEELTRQIVDTGWFRRGVADLAEQTIGTRIGNALRVAGIGRLEMDKAFAAAWKPQLDNAIDDRIRRKVFDAVDKLVVERLDSIKAAAEKVR